MGDVINLRQARKARKRAEGLRLAEANRAKHASSIPNARTSELGRLTSVRGAGKAP